MKTISTVCFTGHRPSDLGTTPAIAKSALRNAINDAIQRGATIFITGGAIGVDTYAAQLVIEAKATHPNIKLYIAVPFRGFTKYWSDNQRDEYADTIRKSDGFKVICDTPSKHAYHVRNHFMVDHADLVIAFWSGKRSGGTYATVQYAQQTKTEIINCYPKEEPKGSSPIFERLSKGGFVDTLTYTFQTYANDGHKSVHVKAVECVDNSDCNAPNEFYTKSERYMTRDEARKFYKECLSAGFEKPWYDKIDWSKEASK